MSQESEFFNGHPKTKPEECKNCPGAVADYFIGEWTCGVVIAARSIQAVSTRNALEIWEYRGINLNDIPDSCPKKLSKKKLLELPVQASTE
jgi:hypothetical protein